jgi:hypothetical protein
MTDCYERIKYQYQNLQGDSTGLFAEILRASGEIGMDKALGCLEAYSIEKRLAWLQINYRESSAQNDLVMEGYRWFYEKYLRVSVPEDGEIVEHTERRIVMRWRNPCPTLDACRKLGLDTREVCKKAYHKPVQEFLKRIDPKLRFDRNYECIRPYTAYCEEIITVEDETSIATR